MASVEIPYAEVDSGPRGARVHVVDFGSAKGIFYAREDIIAAVFNQWLTLDDKAGVDRLVNDFKFHSTGVCHRNAYAGRFQFPGFDQNVIF
jgi:hypothetical protein